MARIAKDYPLGSFRAWLLDDQNFALSTTTSYVTFVRKILRIMHGIPSVTEGALSFSDPSIALPVESGAVSAWRKFADFYALVVGGEPLPDYTPTRSYRPRVSNFTYHIPDDILWLYVEIWNANTSRTTLNRNLLPSLTWGLVEIDADGDVKMRHPRGLPPMGWDRVPYVSHFQTIRAWAVPPGRDAYDVAFIPVAPGSSQPLPGWKFLVMRQDIERRAGRDTARTKNAARRVSRDLPKTSEELAALWANPPTGRMRSNIDLDGGDEPAQPPPGGVSAPPDVSEGASKAVRASTGTLEPRPRIPNGPRPPPPPLRRSLPVPPLSSERTSKPVSPPPKGDFKPIRVDSVPPGPPATVARRLQRVKAPPTVPDPDVLGFRQVDRPPFRKGFSSRGGAPTLGETESRAQTPRGRANGEVDGLGEGEVVLRGPTGALGGLVNGSITIVEGDDPTFDELGALP